MNRRGGDLYANPLADRETCPCIAAGEQDEEFLASIAPDEVITAQLIIADNLINRGSDQITEIKVQINST